MTDTNPVVDVNTDDLDAFNDLLNGKADAAPVQEEVEEEVVDENDAADSGDEHEEEVDDSQEESDAADDEDEDEAEPEPEPTPKKRPSVRERINELTADKYDAIRRAEAAERELAAFKAAKEPVKKEEVAPLRVAPTPDDVDDKGELLYPLGEFDPKFISALTVFTIEEQNAKFEENRRQREAEESRSAEADALNAAWNEKLVEAEADLEDLRPKIATLESEFADLNPDYGVYLAETIMAMEEGPLVLYYLAENKAEARKIVASGPAAATIALGKIESRIQAALKAEDTPATPPTRQTKAPTPPIVTRGNMGRSGTRPDTDDLDAFDALLWNRKKR